MFLSVIIVYLDSNVRDQNFFQFGRSNVRVQVSEIIKNETTLTSVMISFDHIHFTQIKSSKILLTLPYHMALKINVSNLFRISIRISIDCNTDQRVYVNKCNTVVFLTILHTTCLCKLCSNLNEISLERCEPKIRTFELLSFIYATTHINDDITI